MMRPREGTSRPSLLARLARLALAATLAACTASNKPGAPSEGVPRPSGPSVPTVAELSIPTCAAGGAPWAGRACSESHLLRRVIAAAGATVTRLTEGIEPQKKDAYLVQLDTFRFSFGVISPRDFRLMGGYWTMGLFGAGMPSSGSVEGVPLSGDLREGHWSWRIDGWTYQVYPPGTSVVPRSAHLPRALVARLVSAGLSVGPAREVRHATWPRPRWLMR